MSIKEIKDKSGLKMDVAESLYWHCLWLRYEPSDSNIQWCRLLKDIKYRCSKKDFYSKH